MTCSARATRFSERAPTNSKLWFTVFFLKLQALVYGILPQTPSSGLRYSSSNSKLWFTVFFLKLQALVYGILPQTTGKVDYAIWCSNGCTFVTDNSNYIRLYLTTDDVAYASTNKLKSFKSRRHSFLTWGGCVTKSGRVEEGAGKRCSECGAPKDAAALCVTTARAIVLPAVPFHLPTAVLFHLPTAVPFHLPTAVPSYLPTAVPFHLPTAVPFHIPTAVPFHLPTAVPFHLPAAVTFHLPTALTFHLPAARVKLVPNCCPLSPTCSCHLSPTCSCHLSPTCLLSPFTYLQYV